MRDLLHKMSQEVTAMFYGFPVSKMGGWGGAIPNGMVGSWPGFYGI